MAENNGLLLLNVRSALNVGAICRSAAAFGVQDIFIGPGSPYPLIPNDPRLPHVARSADAKIAKTALGAQEHLSFTPLTDIATFLKKVAQDYHLLALEQHSTAIALNKFSLPRDKPFLLIVGHETEGIPPTILNVVETILEIPHSTNKESLNVSVATGIALFWLYHRSH